MEKILEDINRASLRFLDKLTTQETYETIVEEAIKLVQADEGLILLQEGDSLKTVYGSSPAAAAVKARNKGFAYIAYKEQKAFVVGRDDIKPHDPKSVALGVKSWIFIPLSYHSTLIGALVVRSYKENKVFTQQELSILKLYGSLATLAIKKSQLYSDMKKALEIRDIFISMAAHELRTPITSISGYIQLLYSRLGKHETSEGKWVLALYEENKRLMTLVRELLDVNRIRAGQLQFKWQECNIVELVKQAITDVQQRFPSRELNFKNNIGYSGSVIGDSEKLVKVFDNILDNAFKYSAKHTAVYVAISKSNNSFIIIIKDQGRGIDEKDIPYIFAGHHKGESGEEGMGIGLLFVENIIRQHRGDITVKSKVKEGTTIHIKLPISKI